MVKTILTPHQQKMLTSLSSDHNFTKNFYLSGGTALAEFYLKHRLSEDLPKLARLKFDTVIDPIQLGSQLVLAEDIQDLPRMIIDLPEDKWRKFFLEKAKQLKEVIKK